MISSRLYNIIKSPLVTEKTNTIAQNNNVVTVAVVSDATKPEIKQAFEKVLGVKVKAVNTINYQGKVKRTGQRLGRRQDWKKAYVTLMPGQTVDFVGSQAE